jgi:hypothetical protein
VITINPISQNCQYIYEMRWTDEDYADLDKTMREYVKLHPLYPNGMARRLILRMQTA